MPLKRKERIAAEHTESEPEPEFNPKEMVSIDTETTGLRVWHEDMPFAVSMCDEEGNTWYCEWPVDPFTRKVTPDPEDVKFIRHYASAKFDHIFHNRKFDTKMLAKVGVTVEGVSHDTSVSARIINNLEMSYGLKDLSKRYLKIDNEDEKALADLVQACRRKAFGYNRRAMRAGQPLIKTAEEYAADYWLPRWFDPNDRTCEKYAVLDAVRTMMLWRFHLAIFEEDQYLADGYQDEWELYSIVDEIEARGMRIDPEMVRTEHKRAEEAMVHHMEEMHKIIIEEDLQPWDIKKLTKDHEDKIQVMKEKAAQYAASGNGKKGRLLQIPELKLPQVEEFNSNSTPQLRRVLYLPKGKGGLGLVTHRVSKTGGDSTDKHALRGLMSEPFVRHLIAYRSAKQAIGLFFEKYDLLKVKEGKNTWALHPGVNQCGTVTFRLSSNDPNLMQVSAPKSAGLSLGGYQVRSIFIPRNGYNMYSADFAQQELRIFASVGQIPFLLQEIHAGRDPNTSCANKAWGGKNNPAALRAAAHSLELNLEEPTNPFVAEAWKSLEWNATASREYGSASSYSWAIADEWLSRFDYDIVKAEKSLDKSSSRGRAKCVVFAKIYGGGPSSVTELLYCTLREAKEFMDEYDVAIPEIREYMNHMIKKSRKDGFIINPYGRKIRVEADAAYRSVNYMIQSTAAIMMKDSLKKCSAYFKETGLDANLLMTIHDEILFEIRKEHAHRWLLDKICEIMADNEGRITVPMKSELKRVTKNWNEKENFCTQCGKWYSETPHLCNITSIKEKKILIGL